MDLLEIIKKTAMEFDSTIQDVTMKQGPGSDGPYVQPEYYTHVTYADGRVFRLDLYHKTSWKDYYIPIWEGYTHDSALVEKLNEAISKETDSKSSVK